MKRLLTLVSLAALLGVAALAADVTGTWKAEMQGRNGQTREVTLKLKVDGEKLTGTVSSPRGEDTAITDGKINGDAISFKVVREFNGNTVTSVYEGKVAGDEIKFKMTMEGGPGGARPPREFTAKKSS